MTLRSFRDEVLLHRRIGRLAVRVYYYVSPTIAEHIEHSPESKSGYARDTGMDHPLVTSRTSDEETAR